MIITLTRDIIAPGFTLGKMVAEDLRLYSCEDAIRETKIQDETAIPYGKYRVIINFSQRFQKHLPLLLDVPGFEGIRIHSGNTEADTSGCILVGTTRSQGKVMNSRLAMGMLMPLLEEDMVLGNQVWIEIV